MDNRQQNSQSKKELRDYILEKRKDVLFGIDKSYEDLCIILESVLDYRDMCIPKYEFYEYYISDKNKRLKIFDKFSKIIMENI